MPLIVPANEQGAGFMAAGYARASGRVGVVMVTSGPGATNCVTPVRDCMADSIPIVVICGQVPTAAVGTDAFQEAPVSALMGSVAKHVFLVTDPHRLEATMRTAFEIARSGRPGPVVIDVPKDVQNWQGEFHGETHLPIPGYRQRLARVEGNALSDAQCEQFFSMLGESRRPLIYAGGGVLLADAADELRELAAHFSIPVAHSLMGKGALPDDHPLTLGMTGFWGTEFINRKCREADCVLALGTRFAEADCSSWDERYTFRIPPARLIQIDIDPAEIGRNFPVAIGAVADLKQALRVLVRVAKQRYPAARRNDALLKEIAAYRKQFGESNDAHVRNGAYPMRPERILAEVREVLPRDALITTDVGWNKNGVGQQFPVYTPGTIFTPGGYATMGFGAPAALATAVESDIAVVWVVMNNYAFGTIAGLEMAHYGTAFGCVFRKDGKPYSPDFAAIARAYGADGVQIGAAQEFKPALERAIRSRRPCVIDVAMLNEPVPTGGHWNINDIYSPGRQASHVAIDYAARPAAK
jgi:acetolactate synthase-1/2/3 large subunit